MKRVDQIRLSQAGFILSIEAVLIFTVFGVGLFFAMASLRNAVLKYLVSVQDSRFIVADSSTEPILIGEVIGFDQHETPLVAFIDYDPLGTGINYRAIVGIRDDRFTSRQPLFYSTSDCTSSGAVCIAKAGSEGANSLIASAINETGSISYLYPLQGGGPSYAVGAGQGATTKINQGRLYREDALACPSSLNSIWISQNVVSGGACQMLGSPISGSDLDNLRLAVEVPVSSTDATNVLELLTPPFITNMVRNPLTDLSPLAPEGE